MNEAPRLLRDVADAGVREVFVLYRTRSGDWGHCYYTQDLNECLFELRTAAIQTRADGATGE